MDEKKLREMAAELAKGIKTQEDLGKLTGFMNKLVIETALNEEMVQHQGHEKYQKKRATSKVIPRYSHNFLPLSDMCLGNSS